MLVVAIGATGRTTFAARSIASGHHMAEEAPEQLAETLQAFFS